MTNSTKALLLANARAMPFERPSQPNGRTTESQRWRKRANFDVRASKYLAIPNRRRASVNDQVVEVE